jgi:predicted ATPase/DNA-binding SARP family transcriptional activator
VTVELRVLSRVAYRGKEITGPRLRGLLALLAGEPNGRSATGLVDAIWPDDRPDNPAKALQILVSRIRAQLGDGLIARTPTGYRLALDEDQIDAAAVLKHAAEAARHARQHDHKQALAHAEAGLALWDGPPKPDETRDPLADLRAERAVTYRTLVRVRALALNRLEKHAEAIGSLTELAAEYPRDEELLCELIRAEKATHGPAAALARYDAYRRALREELGADPGPALRQAHQELLQDEQPTVRHGVAHEPNPLLGRDDDLDNLADLLNSARVVSVVGPGGLGKTRLAHAVSRAATARTVYFVELAGVAPDGDVLAEVASTIGAVEFAKVGTNPVASIIETLGASALLVLDNCEHVLAKAADLVATLVAMARDLRILTTSRAPLGLTSESVYLLPELDQATTEELFRQRATAARPGVDLPAGTVAELCARLDGLPLAVELAAARVRVLSVAEINRRLADRFALLRGGSRDAPQRHHTLHAVVDWSWHLLDADGKAALRALSIFPGGFTGEAAGHVLGHDVLEHLVDQSLLKVTDTPTGVRFRMLETVREFGAARLAESGDTEHVIDGFLSWVRDFARDHHDAVFGPDPVPAGDVIRIEQDNLRLALRHGLARGDGASVAAAAALLATVWTVDGNYIRAGLLATETAQLMAHYRPAPDAVDVARTAMAMCLINALAVHAQGSARMLHALRQLPPATPDTAVRALATALATPDVFAPDHAALRAMLDTRPSHLAAIAALILSYYAEQDGDLADAADLCEPLVTVWATSATPWLWILSLARIGELTLRVERNEEALAHFTEAAHQLEKIGAPRDVVGVSWGVMLANLQLGRLDEAEHWLGRASADNAGSPEEDVNVDVGAFMFVLAARAELALARGEVDEGLRLWRRAAAVDLPGAQDDDFRPWALETEGGAVAAHARFGRLNWVADLLAVLPHKLARLLRNPLEHAPAYVVEQQFVGAVLIALGMADLVSGKAATGARLIALAEKFKYVRGFRPTMTTAELKAAVADEPAYADAVSEYAGLDRAGLRAAALAVLDARD